MATRLRLPLTVLYSNVGKPLPALEVGYRMMKRLSLRSFSDAHPYKLISVDPNEINKVSNPAKEWWSIPGEVVGGDWDRQSVSIEDEIVFKTISNHIKRGEPLAVDAYREYYHKHMGTWAQQGWGETFQERCEQISSLISRIEEHGFRTQRELFETTDSVDLKRQNNDSIHPLLNEIRVDIDRDGGFHFWRCGSHRLAIAQALELPTIPVLVGTRHDQWQHLRDRYHSAIQSGEDLQPFNELCNHPDLLEFHDQSNEIRAPVAAPLVKNAPTDPSM